MTFNTRELSLLMLVTIAAYNGTFANLNPEEKELASQLIQKIRVMRDNEEKEHV